ncbi:uncharacterized protein BCR38DRAFT_485835 [Pseudomassariella vexata]|uniref:GPI anchored protein n=1 Tax=Pseudomassariella vexata TaxID=1141098 RepID=A0A1Y2DWR6_9PEZI|nr:uncharacterized protein BCR38DRAFT_485835 [Pseudomassariella vexata]ORY63065.1 hypothetical protein BCR38DRAFT_485835 [Pseudomassariella vexata]
MSPTRSLLLASAFAASGVLAAQPSKVVSLFLPGFEPQPLVASVVAAMPAATTYFLECDSSDSTECGIAGGISVVGGPSTFEMVSSVPGITYSEACKITKTADVAECTYSVGGSLVDSPTSGLLAASGLQDYYIPVTVTAGLSLLSGGEGTATATATATSTVDSTITSMGSAVFSSGSADPAATGTGSDGNSTTPATTTTSGGAGSSASTAGVPQMTWNAVFMGAAALVGGAIAL